MLPTIKSDSIYPLPNDVAIFNINIVDIIFLIGIICLIIKKLRGIEFNQYLFSS